jgi:hypothetical protein
VRKERGRMREEVKQSLSTEKEKLQKVGYFHSVNFMRKAKCKYGSR